MMTHTHDDLKLLNRNQLWKIANDLGCKRRVTKIDCIQEILNFQQNSEPADTQDEAPIAIDWDADFDFRCALNKQGYQDAIAGKPVSIDHLSYKSGYSRAKRDMWTPVGAVAEAAVLPLTEITEVEVQELQIAPQSSEIAIVPVSLGGLPIYEVWQGAVFVNVFYEIFGKNRWAVGESDEIFQSPIKALAAILPDTEITPQLFPEIKSHVKPFLEDFLLRYGEEIFCELIQEILDSKLAANGGDRHQILVMPPDYDEDLVLEVAYTSAKIAALKRKSAVLEEYALK